MTSVVVAATAERELRSLIQSHSLPLEPLRDFPLLGAALDRRWIGLRFIIGPWRWMVIVYRYDQSIERVEIVSIQDGRSAQAPVSQ